MLRPLGIYRRAPMLGGAAVLPMACMAALLACGYEPDGVHQECSARELRIQGQAVDYFTLGPVAAVRIRLDSLYTIDGLYGQQQTVETGQADTNGGIAITHRTDVGIYSRWELRLDASERFIDTLVDTANGAAYEYSAEKYFGQATQFSVPYASPDSHGMCIDRIDLGQVRFLPEAFVWFRLHTDSPLQLGDTLGFDGGWVVGDTIMDWRSPVRVVGDSVYTTRWSVKRGAASRVFYQDTLFVPRWSVREYVLVY